MTHPIFVTGAAGRVGGVGSLVVEALQRRGLAELLVVIEIVAAKA